MPRKVTKKDRILALARDCGWTHVGEDEWIELRRALPDVSDDTIRKAGLPVDAPWCGISQHTFEELESSLREFSVVYADRDDLRSYCRAEVISARKRAMWIANRETSDPEVRRRKQEMADWMLVWLNNPAVFPSWITALRRPGDQCE